MTKAAGSAGRALAYSFMIAGILAFVGFNFSSHGGSLGWEVWPTLFEMIQTPSSLDRQDMAIAASILTLAFVVLACLPIVHWFGGSRLMRGILGFLSIMAASVLWFYLATESFILMVVLLALAPTFTFVGLLCFRPAPPAVVHPEQNRPPL